jgi:hypothetical protein
VATTTLDSGAVTDLAVSKRWRRSPTTLDGAPSAAVTTYYYRTTGGTRASTTDAGSIPAGAVVERVT